MALLNREDGIKFILRAYRERFVITKRSLLVQRIRLFAEQHGQYAYFSQIIDEQFLEIAFSANQGFLLGEIIWDYFDKPRYLIFCERLQQDPQQLLTIVVRDGSIYLDTLLQAEELASELLPLLAAPHPFRIITVGDVPVSLNIENNHFTLPNALIGSFEKLTEPLFPYLPATATYELQPLTKLLTSKVLGQQISWPIVIPAMALIALLLVWWFYPTPPERPTNLSPISTTTTHSYTEYYQNLSTPGPETIIQQLVILVNTMFLLPGWQATTFNFTNNHYQISLARFGGDIDWLNSWAKHNHIDLTLSTHGAEIQYQSHLLMRSKPENIFLIQQVISLIDDKLEQVVSDDGFIVGAPIQEGEATKVPITINLTQVSSPLLTLIGEILGNDLPISIEKIQLNQQDSNLLNGSIQLSVWGKYHEQ